MPKGIPKNEKIILKRLTTKGELFYITTTAAGDCYFLYKTENGTAVKIAKGSTPPSLEEKYIKE